MLSITITNEKKGLRMDSFVVQNFDLLSRNFLTKHWGTLVQVNDSTEKPSYKLRIGDKVDFHNEKMNELLKENEIEIENIVPQQGKLNIVNETKDFLILNKPKGIPVHPGINFNTGTLANYVVGYLQSKNEWDERIERGGIVHRLDKSVSGLIVFAKTYEIQRYLQEEFEKHRVNKVYKAKVHFKDNALAEVKEKFINASRSEKKELDKFIDNNFQITHEWYKAEGYIGRSSVNRRKMSFKSYQSGNSKYALSYLLPLDKDELLINIKTGRMYQIRATLESLGIVIDGDTLFETIKGGTTPEKIDLESVLLAFTQPSGDMVVSRLI